MPKGRSYEFALIILSILDELNVLYALIDVFLVQVLLRNIYYARVRKFHSLDYVFPGHQDEDEHTHGNRCLCPWSKSQKSRCARFLIIGPFFCSSNSSSVNRLG